MSKPSPSKRSEQAVPLPETVVKARPHSSRKVIFAELVAGVLYWGESVGLSGRQMTNILESFKEDNPKVKREE